MRFYLKLSIFFSKIGNYFWRKHVDKAKSTVSDKAYSNMKKGFPKKKPK